MARFAYSQFTFFLFLFVSMSIIQVSMAGKDRSLTRSECGRVCGYRCSKTHHRKPCMFFCNKCCAKCLCVPSGTYDHKEECACYNNWKTKEGRPKCP